MIRVSVISVLWFNWNNRSFHQLYIYDYNLFYYIAFDRLKVSFIFVNQGMKWIFFSSTNHSVQKLFGLSGYLKKKTFLNQNEDPGKSSF